MRDWASQERVKYLHPAIVMDVIAAIDEIEMGLPEWVAVRIVQGKRTKAEQDNIYAQGRTRPGKIVTKAKWYQTFHFYGLAVDFAILIDKDRNGIYDELSWSMVADSDADKVTDWMEVVNVFLKYGFSWGGVWRSFKDYPHVEKTYGHTWQTLYAKYLSKDFIPGTDFINLI